MRGALRETGRRSGRNRPLISDLRKILAKDAHDEGLVRSANCDSCADRHEPGGVRLASSISLKISELRDEWRFLAGQTFALPNGGHATPSVPLFCFRATSHAFR